MEDVWPLNNWRYECFHPDGIPNGEWEFVCLLDYKKDSPVVATSNNMISGYATYPDYTQRILMRRPVRPGEE